MNERDFLYWLQGFLEISGTKTLDENQIQIIKDHLNVVFEKITPDYKVLDRLPPPPQTPPVRIMKDGDTSSVKSVNKTDLDYDKIRNNYSKSSTRYC